MGLVALLTEACLGIPQLLKNCQRKSTTGMNAKMVILWLMGDVGKTIYFIVRESPPQFYICSFLQISIDILILIQVWIFGRRTTSNSLPNYIERNSKSKATVWNVHTVLKNATVSVWYLYRLRRLRWITLDVKFGFLPDEHLLY